MARRRYTHAVEPFPVTQRVARNILGPDAAPADLQELASFIEHETGLSGMMIETAALIDELRESPHGLRALAESPAKDTLKRLQAIMRGIIE